MFILLVFVVVRSRHDTRTDTESSRCDGQCSQS